jgi:hypothetical protein
MTQGRHDVSTIPMHYIEFIGLTERRFICIPGVIALHNRQGKPLFRHRAQERAPGLNSGDTP